MTKPTALQRCDTFVGRTMNWLYEHLRFLRAHEPIILCDRLDNREEFPELRALVVNRQSLSRRAWRKWSGQDVYPPDVYRVRKHSPRVLHSHFGYVAVGDRGMARALRVPWLVAFYGADVYMLGRDPAWRERYREVFEEAAVVLALGPAMADMLRELGCQDDKIVVHPLGIDTRGIVCSPRSFPGDRPLRVLFAGTFREKKGIEHLVRGAHLARSEGVRLELHLVGDAAGQSGDAETKTAVLRLIREFHLEPFVAWHSWLRFDQLLELAGRCEIFCAPSVTARNGDAEGTPFVIQQMMASGMPVITTTHSDIPFIFGPHAHKLVPERDAAAIARQLVFYADHTGEITTVGAELAHHIRTNFDVRMCAGRLDAIYGRCG